MKIKLSSTSGTFATVNSIDTANEVCKAIFKRQYWSDIYYDIQFDSVNSISGSIDLEPQSFHKGHQNSILSNHIRTFYGNLSKQPLNTFPFYFTPEDMNLIKFTLTQF